MEKRIAMSDVQRHVSLRKADARPVLDFARPQARSGGRLPLILLLVLVAAVLSLQARRLWQPPAIATVVPEKSQKMMVSEKTGNVAAPVAGAAEEGERTQLAAVDKALADRSGKPVVAAILQAQDKSRADVKQLSRHHRPALQAPPRITLTSVSSTKKADEHVKVEALPENVVSHAPEQQMVKYEVTLRSHVRLTTGNLN
jgi:hypothetical protein